MIHLPACMSQIDNTQAQLDNNHKVSYSEKYIFDYYTLNYVLRIVMI